MTFQYPKLSDLKSSTLTVNPARPKAAYAAIGPDGNVVEVSDSRQVATRALGPDMYVHFDDDDFDENLEDTETEPSPNPAGDNPRRALERAGLEKLNFDDVMKIDVKDAHRVLLPYFQMLKRGDQVIKSYLTPEGMAQRFLGQNYKTSKETPEDPSLVMGLTLLPADRLTTQYRKLDPYKNSEVLIAVNRLLRTDGARSIAAVHEHFTPRKKRQQWTLCSGSTVECKNSCLVYTGRNVADTYNHRRKAVGTLALLEQPEHFCRMLIEAITLHSRSEACREMKPYVRLNVLSDVPWELLIPDMFSFFAERSSRVFTPPAFYDYTKLANRTPPPNYDLTFSFSGTNEGLARSEIARGRRIAVVFLAMRPKGKREKWETFRYTGKSPAKGVPRPQAPLPDTFWDLPVIDGDVSDVRPRDPPNEQVQGPCIVGLRWKTPAGGRVDPTDDKFSFVTRVYHVSGEIFPEYEREAAQSLRHGEMEYLASPVTARFQPIHENAD